MKVRRQVSIDEDDNRKLEQQSRATGVAVSELMRRAIHDSLARSAALGDGEAQTEHLRQLIREAKEAKERTPTLSWAEVFAGAKVEVGSRGGSSWIYDRVLDAEWEEELDKELNALERNA